MKKKPFLYLALLLPLLVSANAFAKGFEPDRTVTYKTVDGVELKLHCFEPEGLQPTDQRPAIVFFFGGGWNGGDPKQFYEQARFFADRGFVTMSAEYRVKSRNKTTPFECVKDGKSAIRWARQHANELGINPNRIVASGGSAGGHVAACTGIIQGLEEGSEDLSVSSVPNAMILFNPVLDTTASGYGLKQIGESRKTEISPCHHVRPGIVPTLVCHGTADSTVPFENAKRFARLMTEAGNACLLEASEGKDHGFFNGIVFRPKTKNLSGYKQCMQASESFLTSLGYLDSADSSKPEATVVCVGDSLTAGPYPAMLQEALGEGWATVNCGKGGATVIGGTRWPYHTLPEYKKALAASPDVVIIMLGTNDANTKWWDDRERETSFEGGPADEFRSRYLTLIESFEKLPEPPRIILATPMPIFPEQDRREQMRAERIGRRARLISDVIPIIHEIAEAKELTLVDLQVLMSDQEKNCRDGVHYSNDGYRAIAEVFKRVVATQ